ncbi:60S ribosomal protein L9 [Diplonema papillatum]|nr:60S ribosomal protein L9 [Diplonema papillatum]
MVRTIKSSQTLVIPKDVEVTVDRRVVTVKGKRGTLSRDFTHVPINLVKDEKRVCFYSF